MTDQISPDLLKKLPLFETLSEESLQALQSRVQVEEHPEDDLIFVESQEGDRFYVVLEGAVQTARHIAGVGEEQLGVHRMGDSFGELSVLDDSPRSADARAIEPTRLLVLRKAALEELMFQDDAFAREFLWVVTRHLATRLRETNEKLRALHQMSL